MSELKTLSVQKRDGLGKGANRRLRVAATVPGVFYSGVNDNTAVQVDAKILAKMYSEVGRTTVFNLEINEDGKKNIHPVLMWDVQRDPCKSTISHVDFYGVDLDKPVKISVPLEFVGVARGTKVGGAMETYREKVLLIAKPLEMPAKVTLDVTNLDLNKSILVADIQLPEGVTASYDTNYVIVSVLIPSAEEEDPTEGATAAAVEA